MRCPYCGADRDRVVDSRAAEHGGAIRRRRACAACGQRFSTYERPDQVALTVRKRDGRTEPFVRDKLAAGVTEATKSLEEVDDAARRRAVARVEARIRSLGRRTVDSDAIGGEVLEALRELHPVAYVRFASVYQGFTSPEDFRAALAEVENTDQRD